MKKWYPEDFSFWGTIWGTIGVTVFILFLVASDHMFGKEYFRESLVEKLWYVPAHTKLVCLKGCFRKHIPSLWHERINTPDGTDEIIFSNTPARWNKNSGIVCANYQVGWLSGFVRIEYINKHLDGVPC